MNYVSELKKISDTLKRLGHANLADKTMCALAALSEEPKPDLSYSSVMRKLRNKYKAKVKPFQITFKQIFEEALDGDVENPENMALVAALKKIDIKL